VALRGRRLTVRAIALLGAGSAAIHQLRYAIGYGDTASHALASHGHAYLSVALPGVVTALLITIAAALMRVARGRHAVAAKRASLLGLWLTCAFALAAIYGIQETLEGAGALAGGGWIGLALAIPAGLLVALALRGADAAELRVRGVALQLRIRIGAPLALRPAPRRICIADRRFGARAPPPASVV
jgi:apolipoprotein N-acyltransferase